MTEWIAFKDRMPIHGQKVAIRRPTPTPCGFTTYKEPIYWGYSAIHRPHTHWMPLPPDPKDEFGEQ